MDAGVEEFFQSALTELKLAEVFGSGLETGLRGGAGAAVLTVVIVFLQPGGEFGIEVLEIVDALFV